MQLIEKVSYKLVNKIKISEIVRGNHTSHWSNLIKKIDKLFFHNFPHKLMEIESNFKRNTQVHYNRKAISYYQNVYTEKKKKLKFQVTLVFAKRDKY